MKTLYVLVLAAFLPLAATAQGTAEASSSTEADIPVPFGPQSAADVVFGDLLYIKRPVVVFADSPNDPNYVRQMELLLQDLPSLESRDVILIVDTDPGAKTEWRLKLRPRGFSLVLMDKDLAPVIRKPLPWEVREITRAIDKFPLRRQEVLERNPAGR
ncbi:MAG: DUF4174 domain-containing protein [Rhodobacteraceae bacterium]|nr:DUF4174 domain-containing protein [Paracoccaceae bacterium]MCF8514496.1 DUF4174 domain-containing protein [Paracoccaceae bacterium]MCF8518964.1 DUF4174 domain-containing protein [Paracoccaceae bacterium]